LSRRQRDRLGRVLPDLRYSSLIRSPEAFDMAVRQGARADKGMVAFKDEITPENLEQIRAYVIHRASEDRKAEAATPSGRLGPARGQSLR